VSVEAVAEPGRTCWTIANAPRFASIVDAEEFYAAIASACEKADESITIVGWSVDSRTMLRPPAEGRPATELGPFLAELVRARKRLRVRVLAWDIAMVMGLESGFFPVYRTQEERLRRFEWELDSEHALGAATHQKVVVVDDRVAFVSGMDLTGDRWDTRAHLPKDPRRVHAGVAHGPYHDAGIVVDGEAAAELGKLVRQRWARATGRSVPLARVRAGIRALDPGTKLGGVIDRAAAMSARAAAMSARAGHRARELSVTATRRALSPLHLQRHAEAAAASAIDRWPERVAPRLKDVPVAFARTEAAYLWHPSVREAEALWLECIAAAKATIYIENQYFTSRTIARALAARLAEPDGPEIILLQPLQCSGWLEQATMGRLREAHYEELRKADAHGRFRVLHPVDAEGAPIYLHSKILVVDDEIARIGSANVSNRSMALDTELDACLQARGREDVRSFARDLRDDLLAEHLDVPIETLRERASSAGSLRAAIDALRKAEGKSLRDMPPPEKGLLATILPASLADPETPAPGTALSAEYGPRAQKPSWLEAARTILVVALVAAMTVGWAFMPLGTREGARTLAEHFQPWSSTPIAPIVALVIFLVGGSLAFPMSVLVVATELAFGPVLGSLLALTGGILSACVGYLQGRVIGRRWLRRLGGAGLNRVSRALASHGVLTIAAVRLLPFAPWTLTNLAAGASHVRPLDYLLGTLVGLVPCIAAAALMTDARSQVAGHGLLELGLFALLLGGVFLWGRVRLRHTSGGQAGG
jgi:phospholipase D1/2